MKLAFSRFENTCYMSFEIFRLTSQALISHPRSLACLFTLEYRLSTFFHLSLKIFGFNYNVEQILASF